MGWLIVIHSMSYSKAICSGHVKIYSFKFAGLRESERIMQEIMFCSNGGLTQPCFLRLLLARYMAPLGLCKPFWGEGKGGKNGSADHCHM